MREGETVYDLSWFPGMTSADPETCCFAATAKDHPVHLYDAFDGHIRASYRWEGWRQSWLVGLSPLYHLPDYESWNSFAISTILNVQSHCA